MSRPLHVLVVDDEPMLTELLEQTLQSLGHGVETFDDPARALARVASGGVRFDLVILDLLMPGIDGRELLRRLRLNQPDLRAVFSSGWSADDLILTDPGVVAILRKPWKIAELDAILRNLASSL